MKKFFQLICSFFVALAFNACVEDFKIGDKFLEKAPGVDVTQDTIFGKAEYARKFLWVCYDRMYYGLPSAWNAIDGKMNQGMFECLSDCWHSHMNWDEVSRTYYVGGYYASMEDWSTHTRFGFNREGCWEAIRSAWIFIENINKVPDMDETEKQRLAAEAKMIIVTRYFDMYRHFGGLPLVKRSVQIGDNLTVPRATVQETNDFMIGLIDEAKDYLPWSLDEVDRSNWDGRFTRAGALGLKCKILLFTASPLFNDDEPYCTEPPQDAVNNFQVWIGARKQELWNQLLVACEDFFNEVKEKGFYKLNDVGANYREKFRNAYLQRGNTEMLISTRIGYTNHGTFRNTSCPSGAFTPTQEYVEMFPMADGTPFDYEQSVVKKNMFFSENNPNAPSRDPRLYETVLVPDAAFQGHPAQMWVGGKEMQQNSVTESGEYASGYGLYKFILDKTTSNGKPTIWPYLRMAEIYLTYAEALLENDRIEEAINQVDIIRQRVGLGGLRDVVLGENYSKEDVLNEILRERACELGFEDVRLFDMCRRKMEDRFRLPLHGLRVRRTDGVEEPFTSGTRPTDFTYEKFEFANRARTWWKEGGFSSKWYLTAFPPSEINKGYGLTQNPGW